MNCDIEGSESLFLVLTTTSAVLLPIFSSAERPCFIIEARKPVVLGLVELVGLETLEESELLLIIELKESKNGIVEVEETYSTCSIE